MSASPPETRERRQRRASNIVLVTLGGLAAIGGGVVGYNALYPDERARECEAARAAGDPAAAELCQRSGSGSGSGGGSDSSASRSVERGGFGATASNLSGGG